MADRPLTVAEPRARARDIQRLIDLALDRAQPGTTITVETSGIRVEVKRDAPGESQTGSADEQALQIVRRSLGVAGPL